MLRTKKRIQNESSLSLFSLNIFLWRIYTYLLTSNWRFYLNYLIIFTFNNRN